MNNDQTNAQGNENLGPSPNQGSGDSQAHNNNNEGKENKGGEHVKGLDESGSFDASNSGIENSETYEGGNLGTAGSGGLDLPSESSHTGNASAGNTSDENVPKVPVPIVEDDYQGGNLGTAGSGGMDIHGSESSLTVDALESENPTGAPAPLNESKNPSGLGAGPAASVNDGASGNVARQPKEHTGKDTDMSGATEEAKGI